MKKRFNSMILTCLVLVTGVLSACAPTDLVLKPSYQPASEIKGAGGTVLLVSNLDGMTGLGRVQFIYGEVKDTDGRVKGNVVSSVAPATLVRDALQQELLRAGYTAQIVAGLPKDVQQGVVLTGAMVSLDEVTSLVKIEAECKVQVVLELWKNGALVRKLTYGKNVSDFAVRDREKLHQQLLQKALGAVMKDATADLVTYLK